MAKDRESHSKILSKDSSDSDSDSGPDDRNPPPSKKNKSKDKAGPPMENGGPTLELGQNKKVKIREFQGKTNSVPRSSPRIIEKKGQKYYEQHPNGH